MLVVCNGELAGPGDGQKASAGRSECRTTWKDPLPRPTGGSFLPAVGPAVVSTAMTSSARVAARMSAAEVRFWLPGKSA